MFGTSVEEAVKRVPKWAAAYYTHPNSYYKLPTSHAASLPRIKIRKPTTQEITRNEEAEMNEFHKPKRVNEPENVAIKETRDFAVQLSKETIII